MKKLVSSQNVSDPVLQRFFNSVVDAFEFLQKIPILDGTLLTDINLVNGENDISHKLGRKPLGYFVVMKNANESVWDSQGTNSAREIFLRLACTGKVTVSLWVF